MLELLKTRISRSLPSQFLQVSENLHASKIYLTFGLQRSGQHLMIDWLCRGLSGDTIHLNHCVFIRRGLIHTLSPIVGRRVAYIDNSSDDSGNQGLPNLISELPFQSFDNVLFSTEDTRLTDSKIEKLISVQKPRLILFLRDPANWLASSIRHGLNSPDQLRQNALTLLEYLRFATGSVAFNPCCAATCINYNRFICDIDYREMIGQSLGIINFEAADCALQRVPSFGGGSSFTGMQQLGQSTLDRWKAYDHDGFFREVLSTPGLAELAFEFFGDISCIRGLQSVVKRR